MTLCAPLPNATTLLSEHGSLAPWQILPEKDQFTLGRYWRIGELPASALVFARRPETDSLAVFIHPERSSEIAEVMGWTPEGYHVTARYKTFDEWLATLRWRESITSVVLTR